MLKRVTLALLFVFIYASLSHSYAPKSSSLSQFSFGSSLIDAADRGDIDNIRELLAKESGINVNQQGAFGATALMRSAFRGDTVTIQMLLDAGANVNIRDIGGATALHLAARSGSRNAVELLLEYGAEVNDIDKEGYTPALRAIQNKRSRVLKVLVKNGANINEIEATGLVPAQVAQQIDDDKILEIIENYRNHPAKPPVKIARNTSQADAEEVILYENNIPIEKQAIIDTEVQDKKVRNLESKIAKLEERIKGMQSSINPKKLKATKTQREKNTKVKEYKAAKKVEEKIYKLAKVKPKKIPLTAKKAIKENKVNLSKARSSFHKLPTAQQKVVNKPAIQALPKVRKTKPMKPILQDRHKAKKIAPYLSSNAVLPDKTEKVYKLAKTTQRKLPTEVQKVIRRHKSGFSQIPDEFLKIAPKHTMETHKVVEPKKTVKQITKVAVVTLPKKSVQSPSTMKKSVKKVIRTQTKSKKRKKTSSRVKESGEDLEMKLSKRLAFGNKPVEPHLKKLDIVPPVKAIKAPKQKKYKPAPVKNHVNAKNSDAKPQPIKRTVTNKKSPAMQNLPKIKANSSQRKKDKIFKTAANKNARINKRAKALKTEPIQVEKIVSLNEKVRMLKKTKKKR